MMKKKTEKFKFTPAEEADYKELVANIRKELDEAYVKGVDFNRPHFLNCYACECFEGMSEKGNRGVYRKDGTPAGLDVDFTVLEVRRGDYLLKKGGPPSARLAKGGPPSARLAKGGLRWRTTYRYICGVCGAEQKVCHVDEFS